MKRKFVTHEVLSACFPDGIEWDEQSLVRIGYRRESPLPFYRSGDIRTPKFRVGDVLSWFSKKYAKNPEMVEQFCESLIAAASK